MKKKLSVSEENLLNDKRLNMYSLTMEILDEEGHELQANFELESEVMIHIPNARYIPSHFDKNWGNWVPGEIIGDDSIQYDVSYVAKDILYVLQEIDASIKYISVQIDNISGYCSDYQCHLSENVNLHNVVHEN